MEYEPYHDEEQEEEGMSFLDHLEALRWHLMRSAIAVIIVAIAAFVFKGFIFDTVIFGPKNPDFTTFKFLCKLSHKLHNTWPDLLAKDAICIGQNLPVLQNIHMAGQFMTHLIVSIIAGVVIAFPYIFWEFWRFIKPALKKKEVKKTRGVVFFTSILFTVGVAFGYFVIAPLSVNFLLTYSVSESVETVATLSSYITTVTTILLASGVIFELPMLVYFLAKVGIVTPKLLKTYRRHALVVALILSAIITPPDVFSQLLVAGPLLVLYEISIYIAKAVTKKAEEGI